MVDGQNGYIIYFTSVVPFLSSPLWECVDLWQFIIRDIFALSLWQWCLQIKGLFFTSLESQLRSCAVSSTQFGRKVSFPSNNRKVERRKLLIDRGVKEKYNFLSDHNIVVERTKFYSNAYKAVMCSPE